MYNFPKQSKNYQYTGTTNSELSISCQVIRNGQNEMIKKPEIILPANILGQNDFYMSR